MFTLTDKNLLIAALESAIYHACLNANIISLQAIETGVSALRQKFDTNPDNISDDEIFLMIETIENAKIPALSQISFTDNETDITNKIVSFLWKNILNKPATFPPDVHRHNWSELDYKPYQYEPRAHAHGIADITDFPSAMPPEAHTHVRADVSDFPSAMPPEAHTHVRADVSDFPSAMPPEAHTHVRADVSDFPATMPPEAHSHEFADILFKPETYPPDNHTHTVSWPDVINKQASYPPSIHSHEIAWGEITSKPADLKKISFVSWTGDGTTNRVLTTTFQVSLVQVVANNGLSGIATTNGALRTTTATLSGAFTYGATTLTLNAVELNVSGVGYTALLFGAV